MASEVVCGLTFRLLLPVCLTAGTSLLYSVGPRAGARPVAVGAPSLPAGAGGLGDAPLSFLVASSPWQLPRSTVSPRNFELSNSPLISYMFAVVINFCRRCCVLGGAGLPRVMGCSRPRHRRAGLRGFSLGAAAAAFRVPLRPASSGKAWERGGFRVCPAGSVRVSGVLCKGKSERLSEGAVPKFREVFRR